MRLDSVVAQRAGVTRSRARALIMEGRVRVDGATAHKAGQTVRDAAIVEIAQAKRFVSRGGEKLEAALRAFSLDVRDEEALDIGASTGGFTDCLLAHGAAHVTAIDVGYGQIDWTIRNDARVTVIERTNFRHLADDAFPAGFDVIAADTSFISLRTILARAIAYLRKDGTIVALVKPQFEVGRERIGRGGVVRDRGDHRRVLERVLTAAGALGLVAVGLMESPLRGPAGNREFLVALRRNGTPIGAERIGEVVGEG
ncbi:MAG: TlyA family RNA methyltransferase [Candidatus Tyrphobacter sp.]